MKTAFKNSIGMFDAGKGVFVLAMLIGHSMQDYTQYWDADMSRTGIMLVGYFLYKFFSHCAIPMFCMICGYGYRKKSMAKCVRGQLRYVWKPYVLVALSVTLGAVLKKLVIHGSVLEALRYQGLPYLLCICPAGDYWGLTMDSIGPLWFVVMFVLSGILLNLVLQLPKRWQQLVLAAVFSVVGVSLRNVMLPFCLQQSLICTLFMYIGWLMKKTKYLERDIPWYLLSGAVLLVAAASVFGDVEVSYNVWKNGMVDVLAAIPGGVLLLFVMLSLNRFTGKTMGWVRWLGGQVMYFCCVHTVFYTVIPWEKVAGYFAQSPLVGFLVTLFVYAVTGIGGCIVIQWIQNYKRQNRKAVKEQTT